MAKMRRIKDGKKVETENVLFPVFLFITVLSALFLFHLLIGAGSWR